jgi:hypothetical protein
MRSLFCVALLGMVAMATHGSAQESKSKAEKEGMTKATFLVTGLH